MAVLNHTVKEQKEKYRSMINIIIDKAVKSGEISVNSVKDLERLVKLDLLLIGEPTDRVKGVPILDLPEELKALIDEKIKELKEKSSPNP